MPPLNGIERGINGSLLKALEELGHGDRIVVVDPSYSIPENANRLDFQGDSSARALRGILELVPIDSTITIMAPDPPAKGCEATIRFREATKTLSPEPPFYEIPRLSESAEDGTAGFYELVNELEYPTLFVRTRDKLAYACATFIVGHSQD